MSTYVDVHIMFHGCPHMQTMLLRNCVIVWYGRYGLLDLKQSINQSIGWFDAYLISVWQGRREDMFKKHPKLKKFYNLVMKNDNKLKPEERKQVQFEREFLSNLFNQYLHILKSIPEKGTYACDATCSRTSK